MEPIWKETIVDCPIHGKRITKIPIFGRALAALGGFALKALLPFTLLYLLLDDIATFMEGWHGRGN